MAKSNVNNTGGAGLTRVNGGTAGTVSNGSQLFTSGSSMHSATSIKCNDGEFIIGTTDMEMDILAELKHLRTILGLPLRDYKLERRYPELKEAGDDMIQAFVNIWQTRPALEAAKEYTTLLSEFEMMRRIDDGTE